MIINCNGSANLIYTALTRIIITEPSFLTKIPSIEGAIAKIKQLVEDNVDNDPKFNEKLLEELRKICASSGFSGEFRYWVLICGLFSADPNRNIVKRWKEHEKAFLQLVQHDGKIGIKHLLQSIVLFFVRRHPETEKFAGTFMKLLNDQEVFSEEFIIKWFERKGKLDKTCALYDRKAEKEFRQSIASFVKWLQ